MSLLLTDFRSDINVAEVEARFLGTTGLGNATAVMTLLVSTFFKQ